MEEVAVGDRVRAARESRGLSVRRLAQLAGCSASSVSQIERGVVQPRVDTLVALTGALSMTVAQLLSDSQVPHSPLRSTERIEIRNDPGRTEYLLTRRPNSHLEAYLILLDPSGQSERGQVTHGRSQEFCLVIRGEVVLELDQESHRLAAGDSMEYLSSVPHLMINDSAEPAEVLWVIAPPDDRGNRRVVRASRTLDAESSQNADPVPVISVPHGRPAGPGKARAGGVARPRSGST